MLGICRGAQGLCILGGGKLIQHIEPQFGQQLIKESHSLNRFSMVKMHHQVCILPEPKETYNKKEDPELLAYSYYKDTLIPEVVYYPKLKAIGIQGHPETMSPNHPTNQWLFKLIKDKLGITLTDWQ